MTNALASFIIAYTVGIMVFTALTTTNLFLQVSAWVLAVVFFIAVAQNVFRGRKR